MKRIVFLFMLFFVSHMSLSQEWMIGKDKEFILNEYKSKDCYIKEINDISIVFKCGNNKTRTFNFKNKLCVSTFWECTEEVKNYLVSKYVREEYRVEVIKNKDKLGNEVVWIVCKNDTYEIQILDGYIDINNPDPNMDIFIITTTYLGYLK